jgi:hypothetical protein
MLAAPLQTLAMVLLPYVEHYQLPFFLTGATSHISNHHFGRCALPAAQLQPCYRPAAEARTQTSLAGNR